MSTNHSLSQQPVRPNSNQSVEYIDMSLPSRPDDYHNLSSGHDVDVDYQNFLMEHLSASIKDEHAAAMQCRSSSEFVAMTGMAVAGADALEELASQDMGMLRPSSEVEYAFTDSSVEHASSSNSPEAYGVDGSSPMSYSLSSGTFQLDLGANGNDEHSQYPLAGPGFHHPLNLTDQSTPYSIMSTPPLSHGFYTHFQPYHHLNSELYHSPESPVSPAASEPIPPRERTYTPAARRSASAKCSSSRFNSTAKVTKPTRKAKSVVPKDRPKLAPLTAPLSELTKDFVDKPLRDIEAYVNRSTEVRLAETAKSGKISRPMNSFMLYRSAFAERAKHLCTQNNHQVVSTVCGMSWPLEPPHIKNQYNEYAALERANHQAAHPGYKFTPSKGQAVKKGTKKDDNKEIESSDESELNWALLMGSPGVGGYQGPTSKTKKKQPSRGRKHSKLTAELTMPLHTKDAFSADMPPGASNKSSFEATNPGKTPPQSIAVSGMTSGTYLQTTVETASPTNGGGGLIENVTIKRTSGPTRLSASLSPQQEAAATYDAAVAQAQLHYARCTEAAVAEQLMAFDYSSISSAPSLPEVEMYLGTSPRPPARAMTGMMRPGHDFGPYQNGASFQSHPFSAANDAACIRTATATQAQWMQHPDGSVVQAAMHFEPGATTAGLFGVYNEWMRE